jgi:ADP-ribose pyrophosphatase YjhB (NUDIX family)
VLNPGGSPARSGRGVLARKLLSVTGQLTVAVGRRAARAILIDDRGRLVLIKRTKPGQPPYWVTPGGGIEDVDGSPKAALHRELAEELGAEATGASRVFLHSSPSDSGVAVQYFFVARLVAMDEAQRSGPEFADPCNGGYEVDRVDLLGGDLAQVDLKPGPLKEFILANREALLAEAVADG